MSFESYLFPLDMNYENPFNIIWDEELAIEMLCEKVHMVNRSIEIERVVTCLTYCLQ